MDSNDEEELPKKLATIGEPECNSEILNLNIPPDIE